jgi:chitin disaccharide deacetylase
MNQKKIIINADDAGMHPEVDRAIVELAEKGIVSSASVMSLGSPDEDALNAMADHGVDLGLHLDLTSVFANRRYDTAYSVKSLIAAAWRRHLDPAHLRNVISEQLDRFEQAAGMPPGFIDGHEHVHQFPVIREALFGVLGERYSRQRFSIRSTKPARWRGAKAAVIAFLGAPEMMRQARAGGHRCNSDFAGVYDFNPTTHLPRLWSGWMHSMRSDGGLIMCHPARSLPDDDPIGAARLREFRFLASDECAELLNRHAVRVTGWDDALVID